MLTPWDVYCEGARLRGVLKHSWIENEIEKLTPERAVERCKRLGGWPKLEVEFPVRVQWTRELAARVAELFSPSQVINRCSSFAHLDDETKRRLGDAIHEAYLESSAIDKYKEPLTQATDRLESVLRTFRVACDKKSANASEEAKDAWKDVLKAAAELKTLLDLLPDGVVFP